MRPDETTIRQAIDLMGGFRPAARYLQERGYETSETAIRRLNRRWQEPDFEVELPGGAQASSIDVKELIARRIAQFETKKQIYDREKLIPIGVRLDGPIGIGFMGDPHVDDDGTDLKQLFEHVDLFDGSNEGLYAGNLGDQSNNWVGNLARLWSEQSTSAADSRAIVTEFINRISWLFFIHGNHDLWAGGNNLINEILGSNAAVRKDTKIRLALKLPSGRNVKIYAVHGFPGKSLWSDVYGAAKTAQLDGEHHDIYVAGHTHVSGYAHGMRPSSEKIWHAVQVASYKKIDRYAEELNLPTRDLYNCPVALIDPYAKSEVNFIRWEWDPHEGAERLRWMRNRWKTGKSPN